MSEEKKMTEEKIIEEKKLYEEKKVGDPFIACFCFTLINEHDVNIYDTMMLSR
jgi:hypothetical protein